MQFKDVIGHSDLKRRLIQSVQQGRISHAQLFLGASGYGNLPLALAYVQYVCCQNRQEDDSCGTCPSCHKFGKLIHPDLHFAFPVNTSQKISKDPVSDSYIAQWREQVIESPYFSEHDWYETIGIENKQGIIGKAEAELILHKMSFKPYESDYKIMLIWLPERMNATAANMLLKLVEEPPQNTIFLLVSDNSDLIIKTILSRTQLIKIPSIEESILAERLANEYELSGHESKVLARLSAGNYLEVNRIVRQQDEENDYFESFTTLMRKAYANDILGLLVWVDDTARLGREQQKSFLVYCQKMIRENFILNLKVDAVYITGAEREFSEKFSQFITAANAFDIYKELNLAIAHIGQNGNAKIIFTDLALKISRSLISAKK
ncbi:MAG: DNA polymerase III subunit delta [Prevotellaceae bacterium]|nr:DNA polymerase III subunit delta [Prevotellaceae bacterium]